MSQPTDQRLQDTINDYWTDRAPSYDAYQQRPERRDLDREAWGRVWASALPAAPAEVLDVGTGSGHVACLLAGLGHRVTGIDLAGGMLDLARTHAAGLDNPPRIYTDIAIEQLEGNRAFFEQDVPAAFTDVKDPALLADLKAASDAVIAALTDYGNWLRSDLLARSKGSLVIPLL